VNRAPGDDGSCEYTGACALGARRTRWDLRAGIGWTVTPRLDLQLAWTAVPAGGPFPAARVGRRSGPVASVSFSY
jgi:hypothetical protein